MPGNRGSYLVVVSIHHLTGLFCHTPRLVCAGLELWFAKSYNPLPIGPGTSDGPLIFCFCLLKPSIRDEGLDFIFYSIWKNLIVFERPDRQT